MPEKNMSSEPGKPTVSFFRRGRFAGEGEHVTIPIDQIQSLGDPALRGALEHQQAEEQDPDSRVAVFVNADSQDRLHSSFGVPRQLLGVQFTTEGIVHLGIGLDTGYEKPQA